MKTVQSVHFPRRVVTAVSRKPSSAEMHELVGFENHVQACSDCIVASQFRDFPDALCKRGEYLAKCLLDLVMGAPNGHTYSTDSHRTRFTRVEIPRLMTYVNLLYRKTSAKQKSHSAGKSCIRSQGGKLWAKTGGSRFTVVYRTRATEYLRRS